jgi:cobalt-zinc-cadmium resistance protein CzcA
VLLLIGVLLYASFGSVRHALLVMLNVPFALVGGIAALWLRGLNLNLSASVGFIALVRRRGAQWRRARRVHQSVA